MSDIIKADASELCEGIGRTSYRKDSGFMREIAVLNPRDGSAVVTARTYWPGRDGASNCYAVIWINGDKVYGIGRGKAGGYGYHKESAALADAISHAGVTLSHSIGGRGDRVMRDACEAIARAVTGRRKFITHEAHA